MKAQFDIKERKDRELLLKALSMGQMINEMRTEITAGITTFLAMAYILAVNPGIFSALADQVMPGGAVFTDTAGSY